MTKWRGLGIPPTRRKLHRLREKQRMEEKQLARSLREQDKETDVLVSDQEIENMTRGCL